MTFIRSTDGPELAARKRDPNARRPVIIRVPPDTLKKIDEVAKRLGLSRAALMLSSTIERLDRMEVGR